jgi:hypothetical protein
MTKNKFLTTFVFNLEESPSTLHHVSKYFISKSINKLFNIINKNKNISSEQIIGILFKVKFTDGNIKTISTYKKGLINKRLEFTSLFKHLLLLRSNEYNSRDFKIIQLIFDYHVYPIDYKHQNLIDETINDETEELTNKDHVKYKEDLENKIKYMNPLGIFKLPLSFAGSLKFHSDFKLLNKNVSFETIKDDPTIKYLIKYNEINQTEFEIIISIQEHPSIIIYKFKDKLISIPKLDKSELIIERTIFSKHLQIYLIDCITA